MDIIHLAVGARATVTRGSVVVGGVTYTVGNTFLGEANIAAGTNKTWLQY